MFYICIRKLRSVLLKTKAIIATANCYLLAIGNNALSIGPKCRFGKFVKLVATDGGSLVLGSGVTISDHVSVVVEGGRLIIESNVFVGAGTVIVCRDNINIGADTLIAEYVVIRDQDHRVDSRPIRTAGFYTSPIHIGRDVWIGCKATL